MSVNLILISERFNLLVKYNPDITYSENLEYLHEQETGFTRRLHKIYSEPKTASEYNKEMGKITRGLIDWFKTFDSHDWLTLIEISGTLLSFVSGPFAPIFIGIASAAGMADAALYFADGDPYMGVMMTALSCLGLSELKTALKGSKVLAKRGVQGAKELIKKHKSGVKLAKEEMEDLASLGKEFMENASEVKKLMKVKTTKTLISNLGKKSTKYLMNLIWLFKKMNVLGLPELILKVGGLTYTVDKVYLYVFRDSIFANQGALDKRTTNQMRMMVNTLLGYDKEVQEWLLRTTQLEFEKMMDSGVDQINIEPSEEAEFFSEALLPTKEDSDTEKKSVQAFSFNDILKNKVTMSMGQEGDSVKELQKMLYSLGYDDFLTNNGKEKNWNDGFFGENTKKSVESFQEDEKLKKDGIVGKTTLKKILDIYKYEIE